MSDSVIFALQNAKIKEGMGNEVLQINECFLTQSFIVRLCVLKAKKWRLNNLVT